MFRHSKKSIDSSQEDIKSQGVSSVEPANLSIIIRKKDNEIRDGTIVLKSKIEIVFHQNRPQKVIKKKRKMTR